MSMHCKYHIEKCSEKDGKYYCAKCNRILNSDEVMDLNDNPSPKPSPKQEPKRVTPSDKQPFTAKDLLLPIGLFCLIAPWLVPILVVKNHPALLSLLDTTLNGYITVFMFLGGIILTIIGLSHRSEKKSKQLSQWDALYSNEQWRRENPEKAAIIEKKRQEEHLRWNGAAVKITNLQAGYFDPGNAYRASSWNPWANSAGGWSVRYKVSNIGARDIKYVHTTIAAYNAVGDMCYCQTTRHFEVKCTFTGPLRAGYCSDWVLHNILWYDIPLHHVSIEHILVEFSDGKSQEISKHGTVTNHGF